MARECERNKKYNRKLDCNEYGYENYRGNGS